MNRKKLIIGALVVVAGGALVAANVFMKREKGIEVSSRAKKTLAEEMPEAYKDVSDVVGVMHDAGITRKVARLKPIGVIKG